MNELLTQLVSLQAIDLEIDQIDNAIKSEQKGLDERLAALAKRETLINELQEKISNQEKEIRTLEAEMADKMDHVRDRQSKMMQVQTGREQTALLKEIEDAKKSVKAELDKFGREQGHSGRLAHAMERIAELFEKCLKESLSVNDEVREFRKEFQKVQYSFDE